MKQDRLRNIATQVLAQAAADPPEWYGEWAEWLHGMLGPPPDQSVGNSAHDEYKVFAMGSLLSWGYFDAMSKETDEGDEQPGPVGLVHGGPGAGDDPVLPASLLVNAEGEPLA